MGALSGRVVLVTGASRRIAVERSGRLDATVANHARSVDQDLEHGRWITPTGTARRAAWPLSEEAERITGQTIASDGGWSAAGR